MLSFQSFLSSPIDIANDPLLVLDAASFTLSSCYLYLISNVQVSLPFHLYERSSPCNGFTARLVPSLRLGVYSRYLGVYVYLPCVP